MLLKGIKKLVQIPVKADGVMTGRLSADITNTPYGSSLASTVKMPVSFSDDPSTP